MEENSELKQISEANGYLVSAGVAFWIFWILVILKEAFEGVKNLLEFYKPIGPLLGLFTVSLATFVVFSALFQMVKIKNQVFAFWFLVISTVVFAIMVFPPVFEPIVHILGGE